MLAFSIDYYGIFFRATQSVELFCAYFYSHLEQQDQNNIGRFFSLKPDEPKTILQVLTLYRNACAHDERLYNVWS